ncbi:MAG: hypothetical protein QXU11_03420 [Thermoproteota archaeon]
MGVKAGLSMELHEDSVVLKNVDPDDLTKALCLAGDSGLTIRYVEPEKHYRSNISLHSERGARKTR